MQPVDDEAADGGDEAGEREHEEHEPGLRVRAGQHLRPDPEDDDHRPVAEHRQRLPGEEQPHVAACEQRLHQPARKTRKSPLTLLPRTTSVGPSPSADATSLPSGTSELRSPDTEPASTSRFVPASTPTAMSPETLCSVTWPSRTDSSRTSPDTVLACTEPPIERTFASPETVVSLSSPPTRSIRMSPLTVFSVASSSTSPESTTSPDAVLASSDLRRPRRFMSAEAEERRARLAWGTCARIRNLLLLPKLKSPIEIAIPNGVLPRKAKERTLPSNSTSVCSTSRSSPSTKTSDSSASTVSTSTFPAGSWTSSSIGPGVWKRCSAISDRPNGGRGAEAARD